MHLTLQNVIFPIKTEGNPCKSSLQDVQDNSPNNSIVHFLFSLATIKPQIWEITVCMILTFFTAVGFFLNYSLLKCFITLAKIVAVEFFLPSSSMLNVPIDH